MSKILKCRAGKDREERERRHVKGCDTEEELTASNNR